MVRLKADPDVLNLINKSEVELLDMTWTEVKTLMTAKAIKATMWEATDGLLEHAMTESDDICAFKSRLQTEYNETCRVLGVTRLRKSFEEILSFTATCNMTRKGRLMYAEALITDCEKTVDELEEATRDPSYKKSLFESSSAQRRLDPDVRLVDSRQPFSSQAGQEYDLSGQDSPMVAAISNRGQEKTRKNPYWQEKKPAYNNYQSSYPTRRNSPQKGETQRSEKSTKRREALNQWFDWSCKTCNKHNSGRFCKCFYCGEHATERQIPQNSWQCKSCAFGRNTWIGDHYCTSCLEPNPDIPADRRNRLPNNAEGYGRSSKWTPIEPAIPPQ